ncbi:hypothetical protein DRQ21_03905 [Candidatus Fermentibacteria bacterium]|nr:MAG: hypothetical protein DRQ21_03905 [Candidatus Fermentibacteria bacterium]
MVKLKKGWEVRILFILALGLAGTLASGDLIIGFIGLGIGIVAAILEKLIVQVSADKLVYSVTGATVGLVVGILFILILKIGISGDSPWSDLLVLIPVALAYVFSVVAVNKGRKLQLISIEEEIGQQWNMPVLVDLSASVDGRVADLSLAGLLPGPFTIPLSVKNSLDEMQKGRNIVKRGRARRATETIQRLEEAVGKSGGLVEFRDFGEGEREKHRILAWLRKEKVCLLTGDTDMADTAEREGIRVIRLSEIGPASREVVLPGDSFVVRIQKKGRTASQGVGFLSDGTMVVVDEAGERVGKETNVTAHTTFRAKGGTMVFGKVAPEGSGDNDHD